MIRLAANLHWMFTDRRPLERFEAAAHVGFRGVELFLPYSEDPDALRDRQQQAGVEVVQLYAPGGDFGAGERGIAIHSERTAEFRSGLEVGIHYARTLECPHINVLAGITSPAVPRERYFDMLMSNLDYAARRLGDEGLDLLIEPISNLGPGYLLRYTRDVTQIIDRLGAPNVGMLYDVYHAQVLEGNLTETIRTHLDAIRHVQVADVPGRHEPGTGEINFEFLLGELDQMGYSGWIGCEYGPTRRTEESLAWAEPFIRHGNISPN